MQKALPSVELRAEMMSPREETVSQPKCCITPEKIACLKDVSTPEKTSHACSFTPPERVRNDSFGTPKRIRGDSFGTPEQKHRSITSPGRTKSPETPKRRCASPPKRPRVVDKDTPPPRISAPLGGRRNPQSKSKEINDAIEDGDTLQLSLSLMQGHRCAHCHCVFEAVLQAHMPALKLLLVQDAADVDEACCGQRPIHAALTNCINVGDVGYRMVELLLQNGASPNPVPGDGQSELAPLHAAIRRACLPAIALLLRYGADPNMVDVNGQSAMHLASQQHTGFSFMNELDGTEDQIVETLMRWGANPTQTNSLDLLPIEYARSSQGRDQLVRAGCFWRQHAFFLAIRSLPDVIDGPDGSERQAEEAPAAGLGAACERGLSLARVSGYVASFL